MLDDPHSAVLIKWLLWLFGNSVTLNCNVGSSTIFLGKGNHLGVVDYQRHDKGDRTFEEHFTNGW